MNCEGVTTLTGKKPQPKLRICWRIQLALLMFVPAFFHALLFSSALYRWVGCTLVWLLIFFAVDLVYFPARLRRLSLTITPSHIILTDGVFFPLTRTLPLANIQLTTVYRGPFQRLFGLSTLMVTAAGGRLIFPGLRREDAQLLCDTLPDKGRGGAG